MVLLAISAIYYIVQVFHKEKNVATNTQLPEVTILKDNSQVIKTPEGYKIVLDQTLKIDNLKDLELKIKDENGNTICTCYYKKQGLVCDNCTVES